MPLLNGLSGDPHAGDQPLGKGLDAAWSGSHCDSANGHPHGPHHMVGNGHAAVGANGLSSGQAPICHEPNGFTHPEPAHVMPIAIVGMAVRLPGDVNSPDGLWDLCSKARSGWSTVPAERFSHEAYFHPDPNRPGTFNSKGGHFLQQDLANFDAPFFSLTAQEARSMDPQQRLLLECAYEALENGGIPKESVVGQPVGVFCGNSFAEYELHCLRDIDTAPMFEATGNAPAMLAARISYHFDLKGPSFTVDTACSSSLMALHVACQSLRTGETKQAIVGASHLIPLPDYFVGMSMSGLFSEEGRSFSFDHRSKSGYGRGEGVGCIILKPLDEAIKAGDSIRAVIRNTGTNQDGRTQGITMPNGTSQRELIRKVYEDAGLDPRETGFVEAHGTGTKVGDPIEARALHEVFHEGRSKEAPLYVGSVKSNVGHGEGASGIVAIIKAALVLEKQCIPPNINFEKPNPQIHLDEWNMQVPTTQIPWPRGKRYVSVSNFGFGGSNVHAVLEAAGRVRPLTNGSNRNLKSAISNGMSNGLSNGQPSGEQRRHMFVAAANSESALKAQIKGLHQYLQRQPDAPRSSMIENLAYTLGQRRSLSLPWKAAVSATSEAELVQKLLSPDIESNRAVDRPTVAFIMTGQGAQWFAMGRELIHHYPVYKAAIVAADKQMLKLGAKWSLLEELQRDAASSKIEESYVSQPACTAIQIALTDLLRSWGIRPDAVVGHSGGETAGAYVAGVLSLEDCISISYLRGLICASFGGQFPKLSGRMMAVGAGEEEIEGYLDKVEGGKIVIACINSPSSVTVSGDERALDQLQAIVEEKQMFNRKLRVDMAYHSHHMELIADQYLQAISHITPRARTDVKFFSSVTGFLIDHSELVPSYWVANLTSPVRFSQAVQDMFNPEAKDAGGRQGYDIMIELGPHSALEGPLKQILKFTGGAATKTAYISPLIRKKNAVETALDAAAKAFVRGVPLTFSAVNFPGKKEHKPKLLSDLPSYPWTHQRYWHEARIAEAHRFRGPRNDILGTMAIDSNDLEPRWRNVIRLDDLPWLRDNQVQGKSVFPLMAYISMAIEAASQRATTRNIAYDRFVLRQVTASQQLVIDEGTDTETMLTLRPYNEGTKSSTDAWDEFRIFSWTKERGWNENCRGVIATQKDFSKNAVDSERRSLRTARTVADRKSKIESACATIKREETAQALAIAGIVLGPSFQGLKACAASDCTATGLVEVSDLAPIMPRNYQTDVLIHPTTLECMTQTMWPVLGAGLPDWKQLYVPSFINEISISRHVSKDPGTKFHVYGSGPKASNSAKPRELDIFAIQNEQSAEPCIELKGLTMMPVMGEDEQGQSDAGVDLCYKTETQPWQSSGGSTQELDCETVLVTGNATPTEGASSISKKLGEITGKEPQHCLFNDVRAEGKICIVMLEESQQNLVNMDEKSFQALQRLVTTAKGILWITKGAFGNASNPVSSMAVGFARSIRAESALRFITLNLDTQRTSEASDSEIIASVFNRAFCTIQDEAEETEILERNGELFVSRISADDQTNGQIQKQLDPSQPDMLDLQDTETPLKLKIGNPGFLDTLHFVDSHEIDEPLPHDCIDIEIKAVGLNFKDVMIAMGQLYHDHLGQECSGVVTAIGSAVTTLSIGDRVCAMAEGSFATKLRCRALNAFKFDDDMSFEIAATMPLINSTAYYSLIDLARLEKDETVLIHAAAGGVGQAAIMLAQMIGAKIFATVGSAEKKDLLIRKFDLPEEDIFFSRDLSFAKGIMCSTNGKGVDVVLNSLAGEQLAATWDCIADFGRFVEIGKRDIANNTRLAMAPFERSVTFASADLALISRDRPKLVQRLLSNVFRLYNEGIIKPLEPLNSYAMSQMETAFRSLQSGKNIGKIVLRPEAGDLVKVISQRYRKSLLHTNGTYLIVGGTGGLGRGIAAWMLERGAKHIVLLSRSSTVSAKVQRLIDHAVQQGATVAVRKCDVAKCEDVDQLISGGLEGMPPVRGMIHSAMVLHDGLFEKMTLAQYNEVVGNKVAGTLNLHHTLSNSPLDFFITLSSVSGIVGSRGQAAYAAASTFHDAFAQYRRAQGLPSATIDLAAVADAGYLADNAERAAEILKNLGGSVTEREVHALLEVAIRGALDVRGGQCITGLRLAPGAAEPFWLADAKFAGPRAAFERAQQQNGNGGGAAGSKVSPGAALRRAKTAAEAAQIVYEGMAAKIAAVLMLPPEDMRGDKPVAAYGLDSLVAIEIRNWISRELQAPLQVLELLGGGCLDNLAQAVLRKSAIVPAPVKEELGTPGK